MTTRTRPEEAADPIEAIKQIYLQARPDTIARDMDRAVVLLKRLPDEEARQRAAVFMDGLSQMRSEWQTGAPGPRPGGGSHREVKGRRRG